MSSVTRNLDFHFFSPAKALPKSRAGARKPGLLRRIIDAVFESDQRRIDREIGSMLARSGGRFTDSMEREMFQRQYKSNWWLQ